MNPPTPAAVRCALAYPEFNDVTTEEAEAFKSDPRARGELLRDHIRACAAEMRAVADSQECYDEPAVVAELRHFADKLEGNNAATA